MIFLREYYKGKKIFQMKKVICLLLAVVMLGSAAAFAETYSYASGSQLSKYPSTYKDQNIYFKGTIFQVIEEVSGTSASWTSTNEYLIRDEYDSLVYVTIPTFRLESNLQKDDRVTVYGTGNGTYTYTTVSGKTNSVANVTADGIEPISIEELCEEYTSETYADVFAEKGKYAGQRKLNEVEDFIDTLSDDEIKIFSKQWLSYIKTDENFYVKQKEFTVKVGSKTTLELARDEKLYSYNYQDGGSAWIATQDENQIDMNIYIGGHSIYAEVSATTPGTVFFESSGNGLICRCVIHVVK